MVLVRAIQRDSDSHLAKRGAAIPRNAIWILTCAICLSALVERGRSEEPLNPTDREKVLWIYSIGGGRVWTDEVMASDNPDARDYPYRTIRMEYPSDPSAQFPDYPIEQIASFGIIDEQFPSVKYISGFPNLVNISLSDTGLENFEFLETLPGLRLLHIYDESNVKDWSAIARRDQLRLLVIEDSASRNNSLKRFPSGLTQLTLKRVDLDAIQDWSNLTNLEELRLTDVRGLDMQNFSTLTNLKELRLTDVRGLDLQNLSTLTSLRKLTVSSSTSLTTVEPLASLINLEELTLDMPWKADSVEFISGMTKLRELTLHNCLELTDLCPIIQLPQLEYVHLSGVAWRNPEIACYKEYRELTIRLGHRRW